MVGGYCSVAALGCLGSRPARLLVRAFHFHIMRGENEPCG